MFEYNQIISFYRIIFYPNLETYWLRENYLEALELKTLVS